MRRIVAALAVAAMLALVGAPAALAQTDNETLIVTGDDNRTPSTTKGPYYYQSENEQRFRKLARGFGNVLLCLGEIPNQAFRQAYKTSPVSGAIVGAGKGVVKGIKRFGIGLWEIATFYHPGTNHYQPFIEPEVVFQEYNH